MTLLEEIEARRLQEKRLCRFGKFYTTTTDQDRTDLQIAFADMSIAGKWIADALKLRVDGPLVDVVIRHRRGVCETCPKTLDYLNVGAATQGEHDAS